MEKFPYWAMRDLIWMGGSLEDLSAFPTDVKRAFGFALREVQRGITPGMAKPLKQFGSSVFELREPYAGDAFRAVYAVRLEKAVYVLHAFKKKSKSGIAMPREDIALIEHRLKRAQEIDRMKE
jgi:phage-related protein